MVTAAQAYKHTYINTHLAGAQQMEMRASHALRSCTNKPQKHTHRTQRLHVTPVHAPSLLTRATLAPRPHTVPLAHFRLILVQDSHSTVVAAPSCKAFSNQACCGGA